MEIKLLLAPNTPDAPYAVRLPCGHLVHLQGVSRETALREAPAALLRKCVRCTVLREVGDRVRSA